MKKFFIIVAVVFLYAGYAYAQIPVGNNIDQTSANFELLVSVPIAILNPGTVSLGQIAPGTVRTLDPNLYRMVFDITGGAGQSVTINADINRFGSDNDCSLSSAWQNYNSVTGLWTTETIFPWIVTLDGTGKASIGVSPTAVWANSAALAGTKSFLVTITASYRNM